jgi:hypothetical protein
MSEVIAWALVFAGALTAVAAVQCLKLYVLRRWETRLRLPDPVAYTDAPSFRCDTEIVLRIHSSKPVRICFARCNGTGFVTVHTIEAAASVQPRRMHRWRGCSWKVSATLAANALAPGFYRIDIEHQNDTSRKWCMCLLLRDAVPSPIAVVSPTNTWNAYNDFGGLSNYHDRATPLPLSLIRALMRSFNLRLRVNDRHWLLAVPLPERRPNARVHRDLVADPRAPAPVVRREAALIRFLERERLRYTVISDRDFAYDASIAHTRLFIFNHHSEYWSDEMMGRLGEVIDRDCSVVFLSGNNMYRKVEFMESGISVIDMMTPQEQVVPLIGTYYDDSGWLTYDGYRVVDEGHWCFEGLQARQGSEFGNGTANRPGASGGETDKIRPGSQGFRVVAIGKNSEGPAFMVCRDLPGGGFVFNVSSISFTPCLDDDSFIQTLIRNLIERAMTPDLAAHNRVGALIGSSP